MTCVSPILCLLYDMCARGKPFEEAIARLKWSDAEQVITMLRRAKVLKQRGTRMVLAFDLCKIYRRYLECLSTPSRLPHAQLLDPHAKILRCIEDAIRYYLRNV